jgi:hypothetical protein
MPCQGNILDKGVLMQVVNISISQVDRGIQNVDGLLSDHGTI